MGTDRGVSETQETHWETFSTPNNMKGCPRGTQYSCSVLLQDLVLSVTLAFPYLMHEASQNAKASMFLGTDLNQ